LHVFAFLAEYLVESFLQAIAGAQFRPLTTGV